MKLDFVSKVRLLLGLTQDVFKAHIGGLECSQCALQHADNIRCCHVMRIGDRHVMRQSGVSLTLTRTYKIDELV